MGIAGVAWNCPHCGEQILRSAPICPSCQRRLRFEAVTAPQPAPPTTCPLRIDGAIQNPGIDGAWEYSVVVEVRDPKGQILTRRIVGVGAIPPGETRKVTLRVEMYAAEKVPQSTASVQSPGTE